MKSLLKAFIALLVVAMATPFALAQYEDVDPSGSIVRFWHQHSRERGEQLDEIIAGFNATNDYGITMIGEYQGGYSDINNKMVNVIGTSDVPDLVVAYQNQAAGYALADGLMDMTGLVNSEKWGLTAEEKEDYFAGFMAQDIFSTFDNQRLGFPPNRSLEVMYYNSDWLAELGFDGPPTTPEEFADMTCKAVEQPFSAATSEGSIGYEISVDASRFASWTFAFGGDVFNYDDNTYHIDGEESVAAMTFLQDLVDQGCVTNVTERYGDQSNFGAGRTLFAVGSTSGLPFYQSAVDGGSQHAWSVAPLPQTNDTPVLNLYGASVSMPQTDSPAHQVATWLFLKYFTSPQVQADWVAASNYFPVRNSVLENLDGYIEENPAYGDAFGLLQSATIKTEPPVPAYDAARDVIAEAMTAIIDGEDVVESLAIANEDSNDILADQF